MSGPGIPWTAVETGIQNWVSSVLGVPVIWSQQNNTPPQKPWCALRYSIQRKGIDGLVYTARPLVLPTITIAGIAGNVITTTTPHGLFQGDGPFQIASSGTMPGGLTALTDYWIIPTGGSTLEVASRFQLAWTPTPVTITSSGTGTITINSYANTRRAGSELNANSQGMRGMTLTIQAFAATGVGASSAVALLDTLVSSLPRQHITLNQAGVCVLSVGPVRSTDSIENTTVFEPRALLEVKISLTSLVQDPETYIERAQVTPTLDGVQKTVFTIPASDA